MTSKILYRERVQNNTNDEKEFYLVFPETLFTERFKNHKKKNSHMRHIGIARNCKNIYDN